MARTFVRSESPAEYKLDAQHANEDTVIAQALLILTRRMARSEVLLDSPNVVQDYLRLHCGGKEHEVFGFLWLDNQHKLIRSEVLFRGTLTQASVYPREVVKAALAANAAAVIVYHNHPSGSTVPSDADQELTRLLQSALGLVDVRVLDHFVVTAETTTSFASLGLL